MGLEGVYVLGRNTHIHHTEAHRLIGIEEVLEVNTEKPRYMLMLCNRIHNRITT